MEDRRPGLARFAPFLIFILYKKSIDTDGVIVNLRTQGGGG